MKRTIISLAACLLVCAPLGLAGERHWTYSPIGHHSCIVGDVGLDIDDGTIILTHLEYEDDVVEITDDYKLYVNGRLVKTTAAQDALIRDFYDGLFGIIHDAKSIGLEGAKIGVGGAKLGLKAVGRVLKMIFTGYDSDDLEEDMERDAERLEVKAEELEEKAEMLEEMAEELEDIFDELMEDVPELRELEWSYRDVPDFHRAGWTYSYSSRYYYRPELPALPELPVAPGPLELPALPELPDLPALPELPALPVLPEAQEPAAPLQHQPVRVM